MIKVVGTSATWSSYSSSIIWSTFEIWNFKATVTDNTLYRQKSDAAAAQYAQRDFLMTNHRYTSKQITRIDTQFQTTFNCWKAKNEEVLCYEEDHNISLHWALTSWEYVDALTMVHKWKYCHAIDDLERLVIQCLFEMTKLGMNGVGMYNELPLLKRLYSYQL